MLRTDDMIAAARRKKNDQVPLRELGRDGHCLRTSGGDEHKKAHFTHAEVRDLFTGFTRGASEDIAFVWVELLSDLFSDLTESEPRIACKSEDHGFAT